MKRIAINVIVIQLSILLLSLIFYSRITILHYINISFTIGLLFLCIGILVLVLQSGFFDFFTTSMKKVLYRKEVQDELKTMRAPSEVVTMKAAYFFQVGIPIIVLMLIALFFYSFRNH